MTARKCTYIEFYYILLTNCSPYKNISLMANFLQTKTVKVQNLINFICTLQSGQIVLKQYKGLSKLYKF